MSDQLTFQDMILRLQDYWAKTGCLLWQPYNTEVGAGTMNPATFLRVLGPEPWNVGYVEPSVRPDDSRYGENPNRIQMHTQYQVILKPDPGNPQELYLGSLEALGIDLSKNDVRFVEDNWESPALGAWGLGWEVWLNGLEITQFTYFQQAGGFNLDPVAVEITYGLERIIMALQGVDHFKKIIYAPGITYDEVLGQNEYEMSVYNLDTANVERVAQLFDLYEAEAKMLIEQRLPIPAYSYMLKTSHTFNILDARGAIGVTERQRYFQRMRDLARDVARLWLEKREEMGFPLGTITPPDVKVPPRPAWVLDKPQTFVLEIGSEELPADNVPLAVAQLRERVPTLLSDLRLDYERVRVEGTPRRLAVIVEGMSPRQRDEEKVVKGPPARIAFDAEGNPTKAALGFARSQGVDVSALERREIDGGEYVVAHVREEGRPAGDVLAEALPALIAGISFPKSMRWNWTNVAYARPLRWIVALLGEQVIPFEYAGVVSGRTTRNVRRAQPETLDIASADVYERTLAAHGIMLDMDERRETIWEAAQTLAAEVGGRVPEEAKGDLLDEVANLNEAPVPLRGAFEEKYLSLPREVLVTVMRKHQRYFPVEDAQGNLLPYFITVANGRVDIPTVRAGNEAVIRARYADAAFFWEHDIAQPLEAFRPKLSGLTFQAKLGSMLDKNERIERLTPLFADMLGLNADERAVAERAAYLCKADLVTQMVVEFTSLAGIMGRYYALHSGERPAVANAIFEHTLPRYAGDKLPTSKPGIVLALADRFDSLVGLFAVGLQPKATADPFALRRAALGVVQILVENNIRLDLRAAIRAAAEVQPVLVSEDVQADVLAFITRRLEQWLLEQNWRHDLVQAVLATRAYDPAWAVATLQELADLVETERFQRVLTAYSRPARIVRGREVSATVNPDLFEREEERALWEAYLAARACLSPESSVHEFVDAFETLVAPIDTFFENVFVMAEDETVRANRLALMAAVAGLADGIVDLSHIQGF